MAAPRQEMEYLCAGVSSFRPQPCPSHLLQIVVQKTRSDLANRYAVASVVIVSCTKRGRNEVRVASVGDLSSAHLLSQWYNLRRDDPPCSCLCPALLRTSAIPEHLSTHAVSFTHCRLIIGTRIKVITYYMVR